MKSYITTVREAEKSWKVKTESQARKRPGFAGLDPNTLVAKDSYLRLNKNYAYLYVRMDSYISH